MCFGVRRSLTLSQISTNYLDFMLRISDTKLFTITAPFGVVLGIITGTFDSQQWQEGVHISDDYFIEVHCY